MDHTVWTLPVRHYLRKKREVISIDLISFAGLPAYILLSGISDVTIAPKPIIEFVPITNQEREKYTFKSYYLTGSSMWGRSFI